MQRPPADLGSGHRRERVGGSEDGLVEHHGLGGHHRHAAHLTHLGVDLGGGGGGQRGVSGSARTQMCAGEAGLTIPYTGTCGVVMGNAMGGGACWEGGRGDKLSTC